MAKFVSKLTPADDAPKPRARLNKSVVADLVFFSTGSELLNHAAGGGWGIGRVANIVGDKSTGKTLLAIEACANFAKMFDGKAIRYAEVEAAFDRPYAYSMGMPRTVQYTEDVHTIEDFERDLNEWLDKQTGPNLYILDSLDACSSVAEMEREVGEASYGQEKAKALSQLFRKVIKKLREKQGTLIVISQLRDNIGVRFGETKKRSGGHALDFYASQVFWLAQIKSLKKTVTLVERVVGVQVRARNKKNKLGKPFRQVDFTILFGYGVDDEVSMLDWLKENKGLDLLPEPAASYPKRLSTAREARDRDSARSVHEELALAVSARWDEIETALEPPMSKY